MILSLQFVSVRRQPVAPQQSDSLLNINTSLSVWKRAFSLNYSHSWILPWLHLCRAEWVSEEEVSISQTGLGFVVHLGNKFKQAQMFTGKKDWSVSVILNCQKLKAEVFLMDARSWVLSDNTTHGREMLILSCINHNEISLWSPRIRAAAGCNT